MKKILSVLLILSLFIPSAFAKRAPAKIVEPLVYAGIRFEAPPEHMGYVEAYDLETGKKVWEKQIYEVIFDPSMEKDVQCVFISSLSIDNDKLVVLDEKGRKFEVPMETIKP